MTKLKSFKWHHYEPAIIKQASYSAALKHLKAENQLKQMQLRVSSGGFKLSILHAIPLQVMRP